MNKYRERFLNNLTDTVCDILKKHAAGTSMTSGEAVLVQLYMRELRVYEAQTNYETPLQKLTKGFQFIKENFGGLLASTGTAAGVDDYQISVEDN